MNWEGTIREDPFGWTPPDHTAERTTTTSDNARHLYSSHGNSLSSPRLISHRTTDSHLSSCIFQEHQSPYSLDQPYREQSNLPSFSLSLTATANMSRHAASQSNTGPQQYQLMSSESPADQAKSMSQVSPGFIFVIFPLSSVCFWSHPFFLSFSIFLSQLLLVTLLVISCVSAYSSPLCTQSVASCR